MSDSKCYVEVALPVPVRKAFTYEVPEEIQPVISPGRRVLVPFGKRLLTGFVLGPASKFPPRKKILPIRQLLDEEISISENLLEFLKWVSHYYLQPLGEVIKAALPAGTNLRSRETYFLTEKGREALKELCPGSREREILGVLKIRGKKGTLFSTLAKTFSGPLRPVLERLVEKSWVEKKEGLEKPRVKEMTAPWVRFLRRDEFFPLSPRQEEILSFLQEKGEISLAELKKRHKGAPSVLAELESHRFIEIFQKEYFRQPSWKEIEDWIDGPPSHLTPDQERAVGEICGALREQKFQPFLLHGVTGSGKTEVYLRVIQETLSQNRQALLLVPEISLTGQLVAYFQSRIHAPLAVLHSGLSSGERYDAWRRVKKGGVKLVLGARSAIFSPLESIGMIIVDEEHDPSYKQEEKVRYHARDLALVRGKMEKAVVVLGSATPSLESYENALRKKFRLLELPCRIDRRPMPEIRVVDLRQEEARGRDKERPIFSKPLEEALRENTERGEQALLFLNRRGFSTFALCRDCGFTYRCPNCSVSLIYHLPDRTFRCHYCDYHLPAQDRCPECSSPGLMLFGVGTQRLEEEIKKRFPQISVGRMDRDTTAGKQSHQRILSQVRRGEVNLLIGTQMITKGHDLPRVTLVGVLAADLSLNVPDFRAGERTFQLLTQVAGRAGRGALPGKVIIQTYNPQHYSILMAQAQDYRAFYEEEAKFRRQMGYPPFMRLINLRLEGNSEGRLQKYAESLEALVQKIFQEEKRWKDQVEALGPCPAPRAKLRGKFRCQMLLKGKNWASLHDFTELVLRKAEEEISISGVKLIVDVDPIHMV